MSINHQTEAGRLAVEWLEELASECRAIIEAGQELDEEHHDFIKFIADTDGTLRLVIGPRSAGIQLVLTDGRQWFEMRTGDEVYIYETHLDHDYIAAFRISRWRQTMEAAHARWGLAPCGTASGAHSDGHPKPHHKGMVAALSDTGTVRSGGHDDPHDPATAGEGARNMNSSENQARDYALSLAASLEERLASRAVQDDDLLDEEHGDFLDDILEMVADTHGALHLVLTLGGPRAELVLGDGAPRIEVSWGRDRHACQTNIDEDFVDALLETWWRPTMEAALEG